MAPNVLDNILLLSYNKNGKHFDFINKNRTSSDALRQILPKVLLKAW